MELSAREARELADQSTGKISPLSRFFDDVTIAAKSGDVSLSFSIRDCERDFNAYEIERIRSFGYQICWGRPRQCYDIYW